MNFLFLWRLAIYVTSLCYCFKLLAIKLMVMMMMTMNKIIKVIKNLVYHSDIGDNPSTSAGVKLLLKESESPVYPMAG